MIHRLARGICGAWLAILLLAAPSVVCAGGAGPKIYGYEIVATYPHDPEAFTQGLIYRDGVLYEGTGLNGKSKLRRVELATGKVLQEHALAQQYFGEGIADWGDELVQLTYRTRVGFVYDRETFALKRTFKYQGEGWGIARDAARLIMSDGTPELRFLDPKTLQETGRITVTDGGKPVSNLNELEVVKGEIFANIWMAPVIARIDPRTGIVNGWIDFRGLIDPMELGRPDAVLNGIAYDAEGDRLFVTGKLWPKLYEVKLIERR